MTPSEAKKKIAKYCAYQERCHQEVRDKLYGYGLHKNEVEEIIYDMIQLDFINEERFAKAFVRGKFNYKKWGRNRIKLELKRRKISDYCIKKGLAEIDANAYEQILIEVLTKKIESLSKLKEYQKNYKAAQFVISKGYEPDLVWTFIKSNFESK
ncbi:MAG: RecX family transcriptional regulator [Bacteroidia bacterium]|nr:RecX family transcriptional regulator [Bacteroidia bacterium]NNJ55996.1 RecX family transcriptional regulator [Bacteroidia bacterium]